MNYQGSQLGLWSQGLMHPYVGHRTRISSWIVGFMEQESNGRRNFSYCTEIFTFLALSRGKQDFPEKFILRGRKVEVEQNSIRTKH